MSSRHETPKPRGKITAPTRRTQVHQDTSLTLDDIPRIVPKSHSYQQEKIQVSAPKKQTSKLPNTPPLVHKKTVETSISDLASQRRALGFDDIPVASHEEIAKQQRASSRAKDSRLARFVKKKTLRSWKEDIKWAINADKETDEQPATTHSLPPRRQKTKPEPTTVDSTKTIDINISFGQLPKLPDLKSFLAPIKRIKWSRKKKLLAMGGLLGLVAIIFLVPTATKHLLTGSNTASDPLAAQTPDYQTLLPVGKSTSTITWHRVSPPERDPVFAYSDTIDTVKIAVSEQPLPNEFKPNIDDSVANLAKSYAATDKIKSDDTQLYIGTSGHGPQSVIFTKGGLLILIKSSSKIADASWARYVQSLQYSPHY